MRDIAVTIVVIVGLLFTLRRAYNGVLLWSWLSYMNPHRLCWNFAFSMPFAQITAITLFGSMILSKDRKSLPINSVIVIWIIFLLYMGLTTYFAYFPGWAKAQYIKVIKIQVVTFLTMVLINDFTKLKHLVWIIALSLGYFSVKGGVFTLFTGGGFIVYGPPGSFIEDNNHLAVAILMTIPLMVFLRQTEKNTWLKLGLTFAIITSLFTVLGSQSRGALLAIAAVGFYFWLKSDKKIITGIILTLLGIILLAFMPESWYERMSSIKDYQMDESAMGRLNSWQYAINAANDNFLGMGYDSWSVPTFMRYAPDPTDVHAAHSIYFSVLADHGWPGLFLFLLIFFLTTLKLNSFIKKTNNSDIQEVKDMNLLARMLMVSFIAYFVGGAFLSLSYFDLPWHFVSFVVLMDIYFKSMSKKNEDLDLKKPIK